MPTNLNTDVITINIGLDAAPVTSAGFGLTVHAGPATWPTSERSRVYANAAAAASDSSVLTAAQLTSINNIFGSNLPPSSTIAAKVDLTTTAQVSTVQVTGNDDGDYTITINGTAYTHTAASQTADAIAAALQVLVDADPAVTATVATDTVTITADVPGTAFTISVTNADTNLSLATPTPNATPATDLDLLLAERSDWFGLVIDSRDRDVINAVAAWAEANRRLFCAQTADSGAADLTNNDNVLLDLGSRSYGFTALMFHNTAAERADGAWQSKLSVDPDQSTTTWAHYTLVGVAIDSALTENQKTAVLQRNGNVYSQLFGIGATYEGKTVDGRFIDLRITAEWTRARIQERLAQAFLNASNRGEKIPYTNAGLTRLGNVIQGVLLQGVEAGHFVAGTDDLTIPTLASVSATDRANRVARYSFSIEPAGAIHSTIINGIISIPLG